MSTICPKDGRPCPDDLCVGSGTCLQTGGITFDQCARCHMTYSQEYGVECACESDYENFAEHDCAEDE